MKTKTFTKNLLLLVASAMLIFSSCSKSDSSGGTPTPVSNYEVVFNYDGLTYYGIKDATDAVMDDDHLTMLIPFETTNHSADGGIEIRIRNLSTLGHTINLAQYDQAADYWFHILLNNNDEGCWFDLGQENGPQGFYSGSYDGEGDPSCFSSGTAKFTVENNFVHIELDGIYVFNGNRMTLNGTIPYTVAQHDENNVVIIDDEKCYLESVAYVNEYGQIYFNAANEYKFVFFYGLIDLEDLGKTIDLTNAEPQEGYMARFESDDLMFQQRNLDDAFTCILNGSYVEGPLFTSGTLTTSVANNVYTLNLNGTMTDGTTVVVKLKATDTDDDKK